MCGNPHPRPAARHAPRPHARGLCRNSHPKRSELPRRRHIGFLYSRHM